MSLSRSWARADWIRRWSLYSPNKIAIRDVDSGTSLTYKELSEKVGRTAFVLKEKYGLGVGQRVAHFSKNEVESIVLFLAIQRLGAILVPINTRLTFRELEYVLLDSSPKVFLYEAEARGLVAPLGKLPGLTHLMPLLGEESFFAHVEATKERIEEFQGHAESDCMIIYTSGTTGNPKGAVLNNSMCFWNSINTCLRLDLVSSDVTVNFAPFFHTGGWNVLTLPLLHHGATVNLLRKFDAQAVLENVERDKVSILFGVPTTMKMLAESPSFALRNLNSLRYVIVGGEPMPIPLIQTWHERGIPVRQGYGLTEFGPNVFSLNHEDAQRKKGSIGFPNFYVNVRVENDQGQQVQPEEVGELLLEGPMCMSGYWQNPQATAQAIQNGWLRTGDLVRFDAEGFYYIVGRKKEMYKSGGENIYPIEIEQVLQAHGGVKEAAVVGKSDDKWGEVGVAFVVKAEDSLTQEELETHCLKNLAKFKVPKVFQFVPTLPKSESGKILKKKLLE